MGLGTLSSISDRGSQVPARDIRLKSGESYDVDRGGTDAEDLIWNFLLNKSDQIRRDQIWGSCDIRTGSSTGYGSSRGNIGAVPAHSVRDNLTFLQTERVWCKHYTCSLFTSLRSSDYWYPFLPSITRRQTLLCRGRTFKTLAILLTFLLWSLWTVPCQTHFAGLFKGSK